MNIADVELNNATERACMAYLKAHDRVTHDDLRKVSGGKEWQRTNFVARLRRMGILKDVARENGKVVFTIMDDAAAQAFSHQKRKTTPGAMWTAMRSLGTFTPDDIRAIVAEAIPQVRHDYVQTYCSKLLKAGYLAVIERAKPGVHPARYRLVRDTGPLPPQVRQLECIVDGNTDRLAYVQGARQ